MTVPYSVNDNDEVLPADINQYKKVLEGATGYTDSFALKSTAGTDFVITLGDASGVNKLSIKDSGAVEVASINSDGAIAGSINAATSTLIIPTSATPSQTTEGSVAWDTDDDRFTVGTGAATKVIGLSRGAGSDASATQEMMYDTTLAALKVWDGSASQSIGRLPTFKYKSATQVFTTNTTYADITASSGNMAFDVVANGVYRARFILPLSFGGTGGVKLQLTGPAGVTLVRANATGETVRFTGSDSVGVPQSQVFVGTLGAATAFSANIVALSSPGVVSTSGAGGATEGLASGGSTVIAIDVLIVNGSTAGTVTLQGAQNSSNSTTTFAIGCWMEAVRVA